MPKQPNKFHLELFLIKKYTPEGTIKLANASGWPSLTMTPGKNLYINNIYNYILIESLDFYNCHNSLTSQPNQLKFHPEFGVGISYLCRYFYQII